MKQFLIIPFVCMVMSMCIKEPVLYMNGSFWYLKNDVGQTIGVSYSVVDSEDYDIETVEPGDSVRVGPDFGFYSHNRMPKFSDLQSDMDWARGKVIRVFDEKGVQLRVWGGPNLSDDGRRLYDESLWRKYVIYDDVHFSTGEIRWVHDLTADELGLAAVESN